MQRLWVLVWGSDSTEIPHLYCGGGAMVAHQSHKLETTFKSSDRNQILPSTNRLGQHPFKVQIGVQTSLGAPLRWYGPAPHRSEETRN